MELCRLVRANDSQLKFASRVLIIVSRALNFSNFEKGVFPGIKEHCKVHLGNITPYAIRYEIDNRVVYVGVTKFVGVLNRIPDESYLQECMNLVDKIAYENNDTELYVSERTYV